MKTPQEKANEIAIKMLHAISKNPTIETLFVDEVKACALIAVDEIIKTNPTINVPFGVYGNMELKVDLSKKYWEQVKLEIEKL